MVTAEYFYDIDAHGCMNDDIVSRGNCDAGNNAEHDDFANRLLCQWITAGVGGGRELQKEPPALGYHQARGTEERDPSAKNMYQPRPALLCRQVKRNNKRRWRWSVYDTGCFELPHSTGH